jgi:phosphoribosylaminoimidazolecarboxamide formyltransferase/IMP cyclohydrolase
MCLTLEFANGTPLRYGENSHQRAMFYKDPNCTEASLATAEQLHGKELSYNNIVDADAALEMLREFSDSNAVAIIKHLNPCGLATGLSLAEAFSAAWEGDPVSAYGSVIAASRKVDLKTAELLKGRFVEILLAPDFDSDALEFLKNKSRDIRLLKVGEIKPANACKVYKHVIGGMLVQDRDVEIWEKFECVTKVQFPKEKQGLAKFSWLVCKHAKSNAIVMCYEYKTGYFMILGLGPGQPNRIDSNLRLCQPRVRDNISRMPLEEGQTREQLEKKIFGEVVMASDAFFPFADNIDASNSAGIKYIVQPGGSKKDNEVIEACDKYGIAMAFTGTRHFRH